jgi:hypothetical protein
VWVRLASWIVGDSGLDIAVGGDWETVLEVSLSGAGPVDPSTPLGLTPIYDPLSIAGPVYEIVARIAEDETSGLHLDAGVAILVPSAYNEWPSGTVLTFRSELAGGRYPLIPPPKLLLRNGSVRQIFLRSWLAVPDNDPNSYRSDLSSLQVRPIDRISAMDDAMNREGPVRAIWDYLLDLD